MFLVELGLPTFIIKWIDFGKIPKLRSEIDIECFVQPTVLITYTYNT